MYEIFEVLHISCDVIYLYCNEVSRDTGEKCIAVANDVEGLWL